MDIQKTGLLIRQLREARGITQKALAEKLHVTDKAVSKWERCLSCPDIALLEPLAGQLGVSVEELLQGELFREERPQGTRVGQEPPPWEPRAFGGSACGPENSAGQCMEQSAKPRYSTLRALHSPHALHSLQKYACCACSVLFFLGGGICAICDLAVFGAFTWSLYPITALIFAWIVLSPLLQHGIKGIRSSLISLSLAIFPFLFTLAWLLHTPPLFLPISLRMAGIGLIFLWGVYWILQQLAQRRMLALALCSLLSAFVCLAVNFALSRLIQTPFLDEWDVLTIAFFLCLTVFSLRLDRKNAHAAQKYP